MRSMMVMLRAWQLVLLMVMTLMAVLWLKMLRRLWRLQRLLLLVVGSLLLRFELVLQELGTRRASSRSSRHILRLRDGLRLRQTAQRGLLIRTVQIVVLRNGNANGSGRRGNQLHDGLVGQLRYI